MELVEAAPVSGEIDKGTSRVTFDRVTHVSSPAARAGGTPNDQAEKSKTLTLNRPMTDCRHRAIQRQRSGLNEAPTKQERGTLDRHVQNGINPIVDLTALTIILRNCTLPTPPPVANVELPL